MFRKIFSLILLGTSLALCAGDQMHKGLVRTITTKASQRLAAGTNTVASSALSVGKAVINAPVQVAQLLDKGSKRVGAFARKYPKTSGAIIMAPSVMYLISLALNEYLEHRELLERHRINGLIVDRQMKSEATKRDAIQRERVYRHQVAAATTIQKNFRGMLARRNLSAQQNAATTIQKATREMLARKKEAAKYILPDHNFSVCSIQ